MSYTAGQALESLPLEERLKRYRQYAEHALKQAAATQDQSLRASYLSAASSWHALAEEVELAMSRIAAVCDAYSTLTTTPEPH